MVVSSMRLAERIDVANWEGDVGMVSRSAVEVFRAFRLALKCLWAVRVFLRVSLYTSAALANSSGHLGDAIHDMTRRNKSSLEVSLTAGNLSRVRCMNAPFFLSKRSCLASLSCSNHSSSSWRFSFFVPVSIRGGGGLQIRVGNTRPLNLKGVLRFG